MSRREPGSPPDGPAAEPVAPGTWRVAFRTGAAFGGGTNAYLTEGEHGLVLVDAGVPGAAAVARLDAALAELDATTADVEWILLTHGHWDHCGLVPTLLERHGTPVALHPADLALVRRGHVTVEQWDDAWDGWLDAVGAPHEPRPELLRRAHQMRGDAISVAPDVLIDEGFAPVLRGSAARTIATPGHCAGHVVFLEPDRRILFAGDHVLPGINPNVSCLPGGEDDPLTSYLESLDVVRDLDVAVALPGHGDPFDDLAERVDAIRDSRARRLVAIEQLVADGGAAPVWVLAQRYPWRVPWASMDELNQLGALGEIFAHVTCLATAGRLERDDAGNYHPTGVEA